MEQALEFALWFSVAAVVLITAGYPVFLAMMGAIRAKPRRTSDDEPKVTMIIAAHNEETCIAAKLDNSLALDYPTDHLEIIVASDGSSDRTNEIVESYRSRGVTLQAVRRMGKTGAQNQAVRGARGEIVVFSDANAFYRPDAIRKLVRNFADPEVACVSGQLVYRTDAEGAGDCERSYWDYEKFMKRRESELSSLIGANGSIYAVRREDYVELDHALISDLCEPLALVMRGRRVVYEPDAVSIEEASTSYGGEFRRKVRILTRSINGVLHMRALFNPFRYGIFSFQLLMHKLMRYLVPLFLFGAAASLTALAYLGSYRGLFAVASITALLALWVGRGGLNGRGGAVIRVLHMIYYYLLVNYALILAWFNVLKGAQLTVWAPERQNA
ncbi:MAG: glycosyltransferase family 2 protein [Methylotetracoccus sp.]